MPTRMNGAGARVAWLGFGLLGLSMTSLGCASLDEERAVVALDQQAFRCDVQPVLMARCGFYVCHGSNLRPFRVFAPNRLRLNLSVAQLAAALTPQEQQANFEMALGFVDNGHDEPVAANNADDAWLLRKPLDVDAGGYFHRGKSLFQGRDVFTSSEDVGYQKVRAWIGGATADASCVATTEVGP